jgi:hypothetical protein
VFSRIAFGVILLCARPVAAQEVLLTGPLAGAPAPISRPTWRSGRIELGVTPGVSLGANDKAALLAGAEAHYYPWDRIGVGVWGTAAFPVGNGVTELRASLAPELVFVPITGKANSFEHAYFRFDVHLLGGPAFVQSYGNDEERSLAPMAGIGFRGFSASFFSNSLDYRLVFGDPVRHLVTLSFSFWLLPLQTGE